MYIHSRIWKMQKKKKGRMNKKFPPPRDNLNILVYFLFCDWDNCNTSHDPVTITKTISIWQLKKRVVLTHWNRSSRFPSLENSRHVTGENSGFKKVGCSPLYLFLAPDWNHSAGTAEARRSCFIPASTLNCADSSLWSPWGLFSGWTTKQWWIVPFASGARDMLKSCICTISAFSISRALPWLIF